MTTAAAVALGPDGVAAADVVAVARHGAVARLTDEAREAMEETGVTEIRVISEDIFSLEILTVDGHEKRGVYVPSHLHLNVTYLLEADEAEVLRIKPDENSGVRWFSLEEALAACSEPWMIERVYKKLNAKVRERFGGTHGMQRGE